MNLAPWWGRDIAGEEMLLWEAIGNAGWADCDPPNHEPLQLGCGKRLGMLFCKSLITADCTEKRGCRADRELPKPAVVTLPAV